MAYLAVAVGIVVVIAVVAAVAVIGHRTSPPSSPEVLIPALSLTSLSAGQLAAVNFVVNSPSVLNATYSTQLATIFWVLTPDEYSTYLLHNNLTGYEWTNSTHGFVALAYFEVHVPAGEWVFAMLNENLTTSGGVGWITALTLSAG